MGVDRRTAITMLLAVVVLAANAQGAGAASVTILEQYPTHTTFQVRVPNPEITPVVVDTMPFVVLTMDGANYATVAPGRPQLLRVPVLLAVPNGCSTAVVIQTLATHNIAVGRVYPEQEEACLNDTTVPFAFDRAFYDTCDAFYPDSFVRSVYTGNWRGLHVLNLDVLPAHVNPVQGTICVADSIVVTVTYSGGAVYTGQAEDWMVPLYARFVDNFADLSLPIVPPDSLTGSECMVFCHSSYEASDSVQALLQWIRRRGHADTVVYGTWTDASLRSAIQQEYQSNRALRWVLLIGEAAAPTQIPLHAYPEQGWDDKDPAYSDFYYSCLDDFPSTGALDLYPDVCVARISPRNGSCASLDTIIGKILRYQRDPPLTGDWLTKMSFVANRADKPIVFREEIAKIDSMPYYRYWDPANGKSIINGYTDGIDNRDVRDTVDAGTGFVLYAGHGLDTCWHRWNRNASSCSWDRSNVHGLQNEGMTPVVMNMACLCGAINSTDKEECLAETWLRKAPGGAVASLGATWSIYNPAVMQCSSLVRALYDCDTIYDGAGGFRYYAPVFDLGGVKMYSDAYFVAHGGSGSPNGLVSLLRSLMLGDPTMPIWIGGMPESVDVAGLPDSFPVGMEATLVLTVTLKDSLTPVEAAVACICGGGTYAVGKTDANGIVSLAVHITDTTQVSVVVSEGHTHHSQIGMQHTPILPYIRGLPEILPRPGWAERDSMPRRPSGKSINRGGWLASDSTLRLVSAAKGEGTRDFYVYDPIADTWAEKHRIMRGRDHKYPRTGCRGAADGQGHVYMVKGNNTFGFWRYDIDEDEWHQMPDVPPGASGKKVKVGSDLVYANIADTGFVYLLKGYHYDFMRFRIEADSGQWELLDSAPGRTRTWAKGSWLVFDGDHKLYAHKSHYNELWLYDVSTGHWDAAYRPGIPFGRRNRTTGEGCCGAWHEGCIYALKGNNMQEFWRYDPVGDSWHQLEDMPSVGPSGLKKNVNRGADIVSGPQRSLYATKGNKTRELWRYTPSGYGGLEAAGCGAPPGWVVAAGSPTLGGEEPLMDGLEASKPRWNWDGTWVCYSKEDTLTGREQIYQCQYPVSSVEQRVVDMDEDCEEPVYSPDGQYIAFQLDDTVSGFYQLCVTPATDSVPGGGGLYRMDGDMANATAAQDKDLASVPASGSPISKALGDGSKTTDGQSTGTVPGREDPAAIRCSPLPASAPATERAACAGPGLGGVAASLGPVWQITYAEEDHCYPEWSPDGEWLCYERDDDSGYTQIWRVAAFGGIEQQLTFGDCDHFLPSYLNTDEIVFTLSPNDDYDQVGKVHDSTLQVTVLSDFNTDHDRPSPAWNGANVAAEAIDDSGNTQIVKVANLAGSEVWLTSGDADITAPDFGQDNQTIAAVRWTGITSQIVWVDALYGGYTAVTDSLAIRDNPDTYVDSVVSTSMAAYEREEWTLGGALLGGGGRRKHGSGVYLSKFRKKPHTQEGPQGASLGILALDKAKPNPATNRVTICWQVPVESDVSLRVYNTAGQLVKVLADGKCKPGAYTSVWNGTDARGRRLANGVYFYGLDNGTKRINRKVVLTE